MAKCTKCGSEELYQAFYNGSYPEVVRTFKTRKAAENFIQKDLKKYKKGDEYWCYAKAAWEVHRVVRMPEK